MQSRYYNPEWGRFINADAYGGRIGQLLSHNLFAYCGNNPVMRIDPYGYDWMDKLISSLLGETYVEPSQSQKMWEAFYAGIQSSINSFAQEISYMFSDVSRFAASADRISELFESTPNIKIPEVKINTTRVGQWMSPAEFEDFNVTGIIPRTNCLTKGMEGYIKQANIRDYYVEFNIDSSLLKLKDENLGWNLIMSKNPYYVKLYNGRGITLPEPIGTDIVHIFTK